jgi:hypothetical protein
MANASPATNARQTTSVCARASRCWEMMPTHLRSILATAATDPGRPRTGRTRVGRTRRRRLEITAQEPDRSCRHQLQPARVLPERMRVRQARLQPVAADRSESDRQGQEPAAGLPVARARLARAEAVEAQAVQAQAAEVRALAEALRDRTPGPARPQARARQAAAVPAAPELEPEPVARSLGPRRVAAATALPLSAAMDVASISRKILRTAVLVATRAQHRMAARSPAARASAS